MHRGIEITYTPERGIRISASYDWESVDKSMLVNFMIELDEKPEVSARLKETGCETEDEILRQYLICQYGGDDNRPDDLKTETQSDYCHCGIRGNCVNENFPGLCSLPRIDNETISPAELESLQLSALDKSVKQIANIRHRSTHTIVAQERTIRHKMNVNSMGAAIGKAVNMGIVKV